MVVNIFIFAIDCINKNISYLYFDPFDTIAPGKCI